MSEEKTIYCGNAKNITKGGIKISVNLSKLPKEFIKDSKTGEKWINLVMWPTPENQYGNDYSLSVDTWKPEPKQEKPSNDSLPF